MLLSEGASSLRHVTPLSNERKSKKIREKKADGGEKTKIQQNEMGMEWGQRKGALV